MLKLSAIFQDGRSKGTDNRDKDSGKVLREVTSGNSFLKSRDANWSRRRSRLVVQRSQRTLSVFQFGQLGVEIGEGAIQLFAIT